MSNLATILRGIAQNDYMIDILYLPEGQTLQEAAEHIESLEADLAAARAEGDYLRGVIDELRVEHGKARAQADKMAVCLDRLIESANDSDNAQYGTLATNFVRDMALAALSSTQYDDGSQDPEFTEKVNNGTTTDT